LKDKNDIFSFILEHSYCKPLPNPPVERKTPKLFESLTFNDLFGLGKLKVRNKREYKKLPDDLKQLRSKVHNLQRINTSLRKAALRKGLSKREMREVTIEYLRSTLNTVQFELVFGLMTKASSKKCGRRYILVCK
jgi:hypothetical protein